MLVQSLAVAIFILTFFPCSVRAQERPPLYHTITVQSAITPPVAEYILKSIEAATKEGAQGLIIYLDTPGGLDLATRDIVKGILSSAVPVIVYVHPPGGRAASAGLIITLAAHVAAMAPGTNIGAAHPVSIGVGGKGMDKTMTDKVVNDAVAYIRGIAKKMGRNADWAEKAVRKSVSIPAEDALRLKVIDYVATDIDNLLRQIDKREVTLAAGKKIISTQGAVLAAREKTFRNKVLTAITDPNIAYILLMIGLAGLYFEFSNPGAIFPGVIGGISLLLALFALQALAVNYVGVILILLAIALFVAEIKVVSHGVLTIGGVVALLLGSLMLFDAPDPAIRVSFDVLIPVVVLTSLFFVVIIGMALKAQTRKKQTGPETLIGVEGEAITDIISHGQVFVRGEIWQARSKTAIKKGSRVKVLAVDRLRMNVEEIN